MLGFFDIFSVGIEIKFTSVAGAYYNTLGYSWYRVKKFFEKIRLFLFTEGKQGSYGKRCGFKAYAYYVHFHVSRKNLGVSPQTLTSFLGQEFSLCENKLRSPHLSLRFPKSLSKTFTKSHDLVMGFLLKFRSILFKGLQVWTESTVLN